MPQTFINPLLPTDSPTGAGGLLGFAGLAETPGGGVTFSLSSGNALEIEGSFGVPAISGDTFTLPIVGNVAQVTAIQINGQTYTRSTTSTPAAGQFSYDPRTGTLAIAPLDGVAQGDVGAVQGIRDKVGAPLIPLEWDEPLDPLFFKWNVAGEISVTRGLREHPTCSFEFQNWAANQAEVLTDWRNGITTWLLRGIRFRQTAISIEYNPDDPRLGIIVRIEGEGVHRKPLDAPVEWQVPEGSPYRASTIALLCAQSDTQYLGPDIRVPLPEELSVLDRTTAGQWIEERDRGVAGFAYYSNPDAVEIRPWFGAGVQMLSDLELTDNYPGLNITGDGALFDGVPLAEEYKNRPWEPDIDGSGDEQNQDKREILYSASDDDPQEPPAGVDLRDESLSWPSGPTKWEKWEERINGQLISVRYREYALLFRGIWVYNLQGSPRRDVYLNLPPGSFWRICKEYTTTVRYQRQELGGWLVEEKDIGWEFASFTRDDTLALRRDFEAAAPGEAKSTLLKKLYLSCYQKPLGDGLQTGSVPLTPSLRLPINRVRRYELVNLSDYYPDVEEPAEGDPPPKFVLLASDIDACRLTAPNPDSTAAEPLPDLVIGKNFSNIERTRILSPKRGQPPLNESEKFEVRTETRGEEGPGFTDKAKVTSIEQRSGRPGTQTKLKLYGSGGVPTEEAEAIAGKTYLFNTPDSGVGPEDPRGDSISFPGVVDPVAAQQAAEAEVSEANARAYQTSVSYVPTRRFEEGQIVFILNQPYRVLGVEETMQVIGPGTLPNTARVQAPEGFSATIGREFSIPITTYEVKS